MNDTTGREHRVRLRALRSLDQAFKDAGEQLSASWVERDPDQLVFRGDSKDPEEWDREWTRLVHRVAKRRSPPALEVPPPPKDKGDPARYPERPWGDPVDRARSWAIATFLALAAVVVVLLWAGWWYWLIPLAIVALMMWRLQHALWESRGTFGGNWVNTLVPPRATDDMKRRL